jgi:hypothetical protein
MVDHVGPPRADYQFDVDLTRREGDEVIPRYMTSRKTPQCPG